MTPTHSTRAYEHLRSKLISGEYQPGTRLLYGPIGKQLGISATPVREAVGQLAKEGLIELIPQLGAVVRKIERQELIELYELREAFEPYAAAKAAERASELQLERINTQLELMIDLTEQVAEQARPIANKRTTQRFEQADFAFHMLIIAATGNQTLVRTAENSHVLTRVFSTPRHSYSVDVMNSTCDDHQQILTAIEAGNSREASKASLKHIQNGIRRTMDAFEESDSMLWNGK